MQTPDVKQGAGYWLFTWSEPTQIAVRIDRTHQHSNGSVSAEISVMSGADPLSKRGHLHHSMMSNLLGPRVRSDVVRALNDRADGLEWADMLEYVCERVLLDLRQGEPVHVLNDVPLTTESRWRLHPILHEGHPTILFGYGGSLKSYLAHYWAVRIAHGLDAVYGNVLILDWESSPEDWRERHAMICKGIKDPDGNEVGEPTSLFYRRCSLPLAQDMDEIMRAVGECDADVLIIDSAAYACGDEPERAGPTNDFFRCLRQLRCTSLIIAHQSTDSRSRKPFGSIFWENAARSTVQVRRSEESNTQAQVGLWNRKVNYGQRFQPFAIRATFHSFQEGLYTPDDYVEFKKDRLSNIPDLAKDGTAEDKVFAYLMDLDEAVPTTQIREAFKGDNLSNPDQVLKRLKDKGRIAGDAKGWWVLSKETSEA